MKEIVTRGEKKRALFIKEVFHIEMELATAEHLEKYVVFINNDKNVGYQFDGEKLYMDKYNHDLMLADQEKWATITKEMEEEGKTEDEIKEAIEGKGIEYIDRYEIVIQGQDIYTILISLSQVL